MASLKITQKKDFAKTLYLNNPGITQKEVAERAGVAEKTISKWVNQGNWSKLRLNLLSTRESQLSNLYEQLDSLNQHISNRKEEQGHKWASAKEADTLIKITKAINSLEQELSIADIVNVSKRFLDWLRPVDLDKAKELSALFDAFIKDNIK